LIPSRGRDFGLCSCVQTSCGAHSASYVIGTVGCFLEVKQPDLESDHIYV